MTRRDDGPDDLDEVVAVGLGRQLVVAGLPAIAKDRDTMIGSRRRGRSRPRCRRRGRRGRRISRALTRGGGRREEALPDARGGRAACGQDQDDDDHAHDDQRGGDERAAPGRRPGRCGHRSLGWSRPGRPTAGPGAKSSIRLARTRADLPRRGRRTEPMIPERLSTGCRPPTCDDAPGESLVPVAVPCARARRGGGAGGARRARGTAVRACARRAEPAAAVAGHVPVRLGIRPAGLAAGDRAGRRLVACGRSRATAPSAESGPGEAVLVLLQRPVRPGGRAGLGARPVRHHAVLGAHGPAPAAHAGRAAVAGPGRPRDPDPAGRVARGPAAAGSCRCCTHGCSGRCRSRRSRG